MSKNNQNPLTENIGGGDDSQNRFEKVFIVKGTGVEYDGPFYLSKEKFISIFDDSMEYRPDCPASEWSHGVHKVQNSDQAIKALLLGEELVESSFLADNLYYDKAVQQPPVFYSLVEAYSSNGKYFVQSEVR